MTMTIQAPLRAALLLALYPVAACAQPAGPTASATPRPGDTTRQAFIGRHERRIMADDTDGDGKVSRAEFLVAAKSGKGDPTRRFSRMDTNGDGVLDRAEIDAMLARRFARLDVDGDGIESAGERAAAHGRRGAAVGDTTGA